jgi:hypothetical protein
LYVGGLQQFLSLLIVTDFHKGTINPQILDIASFLLPAVENEGVGMPRKSGVCVNRSAGMGNAISN